ncbi:hypothetical protein BJQ94_14515 [Cryobacterium sp. SO2]|uniref:hypothetical protein n=1 Tax=Cryobacterium sp. SO2 TaxID=1897060 RepID=UPI00223D0018|nr:hypothetical protein [Cryobacterium sp. SO2]WEO76567.1 hypothetical protein BJQ94_14515 [Cryobacterium sp. SO2]
MNGTPSTAAAQVAVQDCLDACSEMVRASEDCADACLQLGGGGDVTECFLADLDCVEVGTSTIRLLGWRFRSDGPTTEAVLLACRQSASASIRACERMTRTHPGWTSCVTAGRRTVAACTALLAAH